jgi:hypothetical protein
MAESNLFCHVHSTKQAWIYQGPSCNNGHEKGIHSKAEQIQNENDSTQRQLDFALENFNKLERMKIKSKMSPNFMWSFRFWKENESCGCISKINKWQLMDGEHNSRHHCMTCIGAYMENNNHHDHFL